MNNYLVIPIRMEKCEIVIRKSRRLSNFEIFILKFIYIDNSLVNLLKAFNVGAHIMNYILAQMFYAELINLDLNRGVVTLSDEIFDYVENNRLDEYLNVEANVSKFPVTIIQEKIGGEIFIEDIVKDYLRNPPKETTNYINLKASPSESFQDLKNYSLNKYTKCIRPKIQSDFEDVEKINFLYPIHRDSMYIYLPKEENKFFDLDYDVFPLSVQKSWQNAYNSQFNDEKEIDLSKFIRSPRIITNNKLIKDINKRLDSIQSIIQNKKENAKYLFSFEDELETLNYKANDIITRIESVNSINFFIKNSEVIKEILKCAKLSTSYILICSDILNINNIHFLQNIIKESKKNNVKIFLIWGLIEDIPNIEKKKKFSDFKKELLKNLDRIDEKRVVFTLASTKIDSNFIIIDFNKIFYNNMSFFGNDYYNESDLIPTLYIEGGSSPVDFSQFVIDYLPDSLELKKELEKYLKVAHSIYFKELNPNRKKLVLRLKKSVEMLDYYLLNSEIEDALKLIRLLKEYLISINNYFTISLIYNFEHEDILFDMMDENKDQFHIITDDLNDKRVGNVLASFLANIPSLSIILITPDLNDISNSWDLGKIKLDNMKKISDNLNYSEIEKNLKLNTIISAKNLIYMSNYRILAPIGRRNFKFHSKKIGIIANSDDLYQRFLAFAKNIQ